MATNETDFLSAKILINHSFKGDISVRHYLVGNAGKLLENVEIIGQAFEKLIVGKAANAVGAVGAS